MSSATATTDLILIVDDHLDCAGPLRALLRNAGFDTAVATSADQALELLSTRTPKLIVLDNHMPDTSGIDLLRTLRDDPRTADIPVVMHSASDAPEDIERSYLLGAAAYLCKNRTDLPELLFRIQSLASGRTPASDIWTPTPTPSA